MPEARSFDVMYSNDLGAICVEGLLERIVVDPKVMSGKPVIHGRE